MVAMLMSMTLQVQALQVRHVAGDMQGHDLTLALGSQLVDAGVALHQQAALRRAVADPYDVLIRLDHLNLHRHVPERPSLLVGQGEYTVQLADHEVLRGVRTCEHPSFPVPSARTTPIACQ